MHASKAMQDYFAGISAALSETHKLATAARELGFDPERKVEIALAANMAERVEGLLSNCAPQLVGSGMIERIGELERRHGRLSWKVALEIGREVAEQRFCAFRNRNEAIELGIRAGFSYHTAGIVSAPLEGFTALKLKKRRDGRDYLALSFAGPVRGAGGTAIAVCLVIADYLRSVFGISSYDPDEKELGRAITELRDYHEKVANLQYNPSDEEIAFLVRHLPIEVDGEPTEELEVSNYRDLPRIATNKIRGGVALVLSMLALKAPKLWKELAAWGTEFGLNWAWLEAYLKLQKARKTEVSKPQRTAGTVQPDYTFISDLVAGRPVLAYPLASGGFRLRYGRARNSGYSCVAISPATAAILNGFIATGTQLKLERPSKSAAVTICDSIDGPIVKLDDGSVLYLESDIKARELAPKIAEIIYLGDLLVSYGDFLDRAQPLVPAGYCEEHWAAQLSNAIIAHYGRLDLSTAATELGLDEPKFKSWLSGSRPTVWEALKLAAFFKIPLHPKHTPFWASIGSQELLGLLRWLGAGRFELDGRGQLSKAELPMSGQKRVLEIIGLPHSVVDGKIIIEAEHATALLACLGCLDEPSRRLPELVSQASRLAESGSSTLEIIASLATPLAIADRAGTAIGARMGRPEKAKMRRMAGSPNSLFPCGAEGGRLRDLGSAARSGKVKADWPLYLCERCSLESPLPVCVRCRGLTTKLYSCERCGLIKFQCEHSPRGWVRKSIDIAPFLESALAAAGQLEQKLIVKGVRGMMNATRVVEHPLKGVLRAVHGLTVTKDGTVRFDCTELPLTHFTPREIGTPLSRLKQLGYDRDVKGAPLEHEDQLLELKPQDIVLPDCPESSDEGAASVLLRIARFVDDELEKLYNLPRYYNASSKADLVGLLVIGLAPHISAGIIGRIIGFSQTQGLYAHPLWHAANRRDCDGDETSIILLLDGLLNFSRSYLPDRRGGRTMDVPLVLTSILNPAEVDDMVHRMDIAPSYPIQLYEAAQRGAMPWSVPVEVFGQRLGKAGQYEGLAFTHRTRDINAGVRCSAYKMLPTMEAKLRAAMELAEKIRAVDASDVARLVIERHLLRDVRGNLRKFSSQAFRCSVCNEPHRRPPLSGRCLACGGELIFTVSEGSITKYLWLALNLARRYAVPRYLIQVLELTKANIESIFGKAKEKQAALEGWLS